MYVYNISINLVKFDEVYVPHVTLPYHETPHCAVFLMYFLLHPAESKYSPKTFVPITIYSPLFLFLKRTNVERLL
jgi:hypothetical protein